ncbi:MAG: hypothetical protein IKV32_05250 [Muribaculaceae bacterium]|nr:hypothetical protein [Muribaculaceae bacterium]
MKAIKALGFVAIAISIASCSSTGSKASVEDAHDSTTCTEHNHNHEGHNHNHGIVVVGVAQEGDYTSGKISITTIPCGETKEFDYTTSNQDKIAAWQKGDTVSIFIEHHHHGEAAHDSITAIKIGETPCAAPHNHEGHNHGCNEHEHEHNHTH